MEYRYKIVKSHEHDSVDSGCAISFSTDTFSRTINLAFVGRDGRPTRSDVPIKLDRELFEIEGKGDPANEYVFHSVYLMTKEIENKFERTEFAFNFLRDYCKTSVFNVGDAQFVRIGDDYRWALLVREPWSEDELMTVEEAMTKNMSFVRRNHSGKKKFIYYNKEVGHIQKPNGWDWVDAGNSALTRQMKKLGPVWDIVEFKSVYKYHNIGGVTSNTSTKTGNSSNPWYSLGSPKVGRSGGSRHMFPQKIGYMAPRENVVTAREYFEKNKARLRKEKIMRRVNGEIKMPLHMRREFGKERMELNDKQRELLRDIVNEAKAKF